MGRSARWCGLALVLGLSAVETAASEADRARDRLAPRSAQAQPSTAAVHPPMPIPDMPPAETAAPFDLPAPAPAAFPDAPAAQAPALAPGYSFLALDDANTSIPPDTHGAVGPGHLMVTLNTQVRVQSRTGVNLLTQGLDNFWLGVNGGGGTFDPRVVYDHIANRWVTVACDDQTDGAVLVGVSRSADPLGTWDKFRIPAGAGNWADYPTLGYNGKWVVVQVNIFTNTTNTFVESRVYAFDRAALYGGPPATFAYATRTPPGAGGTHVPAITYDSLLPDLYLLQSYSSAGGQLALYKLTGSVSSPTIQFVGYPTAPTPWSLGANGGVDFAPQAQGLPGCQYCEPVGSCTPPVRKIQTNDSRMQSVVYRNGHIWAAHTVFFPSGGNPTRSSIQWWQVTPGAVIAQRGLVDDSTNQRFFAFPSLAVNKNDDVLLGYSRFQGDQHAGASYSFRTAIDTPNAMQSESPLKDGSVCYYKDFFGGRNRWGDYSATVVDPTDDIKMWTIQEYAASSASVGQYDDDLWGTWWGMLDPTPAISIADVAVSEGDSGTTLLTFDVSLSLATSQEVKVDWSTANATATVADGDYVAGSGTVTFAPGVTTRQIQVTVNGDPKREPVETLLVNLLTVPSPVNATLADAQAVGTILNDDSEPQISISDVQVLEGSPSGTTPAVFRVTLSNPSSTPVTVTFNAAGGTATPGSVLPADFNPATGTVTFLAGDVEETVTVTVLADPTVEANETFFVNLTSPSGGTILKGIGNGVILNDDSSTSFPGVSSLVVVSDGSTAGNSGRNRLYWVNPVTTTATRIRIQRKDSTLPTTCPFPSSEGDGTTVADLAFGGSGTTQSHPDVGLDLNDAYCYAVFVEYPSSNFSGGAHAEGRPFDAVSQKTRWKYYTGITTVAAPTVGSDGVLLPSNDNYVHAMVRGDAGGGWPASWKPANLGSPAQARSPIVPFTGGSRAFYSTLDGWVHAIDAKTGAVLWETRIGTEAGGAPAGIFTAFGGAWDYILVGTRQAANNLFYALDPTTGAVIDSFPSAAELALVGEIGAVTGMAAVDYARGQVYFGTSGGATNALWCLKLGPTSDALKRGWEVPRAVTNNIDGSPVTRGDRVYVGSTAGLLWSIRATDGLDRYSHTPTGPPEAIKGFPFPDRGSQALYFSTTTRVHSAVDNGPLDFFQKWAPQTGLTSPSPTLFWAAQGRLYVGLQAYPLSLPGAWLYDIDAATGAASPIQLENGLPAIAIGAPSLDTGSVPPMLHAGSVAGVIYAVQVP